MDRNWNYFRGPPALGVWPLSSEVPIGNGAEGTQGSVLRARALGQDEILHRATDSGKARGHRNVNFSPRDDVDIAAASRSHQLVDFRGVVEGSPFGVGQDVSAARSVQDSLGCFEE